MNKNCTQCNYYLAEACNNTFILFDCLSKTEVDQEFLKQAHACLIKEGRDDCLILIDGHVREDAFYARMLVLGADAEMGEFCGNGSRACSSYLHSKYPQFQKFYLIANGRDNLLLRHEDGTYSTKLSSIRFEINEKFIAKPELFQKEDGFYYFSFKGKRLLYAEIIEPHLVVQEEMSDEELLALGRELNQRTDIFPHGMNVNSAKFLQNNALYVKTYERGVQRLTRSCGTGSSASVALYLKGTHGKVKVTTPGGGLEITIGDASLELKGPASVVHQPVCVEK